MRELITRYGRKNLGFLWLFFQPILFTGVMSALWALTRHLHNSSLQIETFALTGYSSVLLWRNTSSRSLNALSSNSALLCHRNVKPFSVYASRMILEVAGVSTSFFFLTATYTLAGIIKFPESLFKVLIGWLLLSGFAVSLGFLVGALAQRSDTFKRMWSIIVLLLIPFSGTAFLVDWLPADTQKTFLMVPMINATEMIRDGFMGSLFTAHYDPLYLCYFNAILLLIALALLRSHNNVMEKQ